MLPKINISPSFKNFFMISILLVALIWGCTPASICPAINSEVKLVSPQRNDVIDENILLYLNAGGDPNQINSFFAQFGSKTLAVTIADLDGDSLNETIVAGTLPLEFTSTNEGAIHIFKCKHKSYELIKQFDLDRISRSDIIRTEKLLVDYPQQVIIHYWPFTGWASHILTIGFMNDEWQILFQDSGFFPELVIFDQDNDGNKEISIHSVTTATQGPHRTLISTFKWSGKEYSLVSSQLMPGTTRVEYLDDAQRALDTGDTSMAIAYYDRAAHDSSLDNFASRDEIERNQTDLADDYQISFALLRLATVWFSAGDVDKGISVIQELEEAFPTKSPGNEFTQAANLFRDGIEEGKIPGEACIAVTSFLTQNYPDLNTHIGNWGVSVVGYTQLIELCPFR